MITPVIAKIISMSPSLTVSENEIAQYVINNPDEVSTNTITTIAERTNTSEASINRFCKKIGYRGFNKLKIALAQESFYQSMRSEKQVDESGILTSINQDYIQMLANTSTMLNEKVLFEAAEAIKTSSSIYIFSYSSSVFVAEEMEYRMNMIGINAKVAKDFIQMQILSSNLNKTDLVVLIVPSLLIKEIQLSVNLCKERGAKIITITSYDSPVLDEMVDFKFVTSDKITAKNSLTITNNITFLYVIDLIFTALIRNDPVLRQRKLHSDSLLGSSNALPNFMLGY